MNAALDDRLTLNALIRLPDGRIGTICYHNLDGRGGIWGRHRFIMPASGFGAELPRPQFMLRDKGLQASLGVECVGEEYVTIQEANDE